MKKKYKEPKVKHYFTLQYDFSKEFQDYLDKNYLDKSKLIEGLILKYFEGIKNKQVND